MPITPVHSFVVACDICHTTLSSHLHPLPLEYPGADLFRTPNLARAAALNAHWVIGRDLCACPACSPLATGSTNTHHYPRPHRTPLEPGHPYPS